ncbi:MAG: BrnT family toxin [Burkholderiales bacterium]
MGSAGDLLVVVYTMRGEDVRLISARRATRKERKTYES